TVDRVVDDREVRRRLDQLSVDEVPVRELDTVGVRLGGVVQVVDIAVLHGDVLVHVEPVLTTGDVGALHRHHRFADRGARGVLAVDLDVLEQQWCPGEAAVVDGDRGVGRPAGDLAVADHHTGGRDLDAADVLAADHGAGGGDVRRPVVC